jgi:hypothetical protein
MTQHVMNGHDFFEGVRAGKYLFIYETKKKNFFFFKFCLIKITNLNGNPIH